MNKQFWTEAKLKIKNSLKYFGTQRPFRFSVHPVPGSCWVPIPLRPKMGQNGPKYPLKQGVKLDKEPSSGKDISPVGFTERQTRLLELSTVPPRWAAQPFHKQL